MATEPPLTLEVQRAEPLVWISRLLVLESVDPWKEIRDIRLHRGLNIVWSVDVDRNDEAAPVMTGHGVGKTTFCRLIRYCMGEATFGHKSLVQRIRSTMSESIVGAEVHVQGESWAVARPLGRSHGSYAQRGVTIEQLLANRPSHRSFHEFTDALAKAALEGFPADVSLSGNRPILWDHILAWCARDQEARYQNVWDWRSPRSDSDTPAFNRPRQDAMFFIRAALGLVATDEVRTQRRLLGIDSRLKELEGLIAERLREPEFQVRRLRRELIDDFEIPDAADASLDPAKLFSLPSFVTSRLNSIAAETKTIDDRLTELNRRLLALQSSIQDADQMAGEWTASAGTTQSGSETLNNSVEQHRGDRQRLVEIANEWCRYGGVTFAECQHVQDRAHHLDDLIQLESQQTVVEVAHRDQVSAEMRDRTERIAKHKQQLVAERDSLQAIKSDLEIKRTNLNRKATSLPRRLESLIGWHAIIEDGSADQNLTKLRAESDELQSERTTKVAVLATSLADQSQRLGNLQRVFGGLVAGVLNPEFHGTARIHDGEIQCSITHGSVLAGEAVETLAVLLTDLACLILGVEQNCQHPGFHIHDSPREADLGARIYRQFLERAASLHQQLGGQDSAPFQYIVTTTTAPPRALQANEYVALRLSNEHDNELLLRRSLGEPETSATSPNPRTLWD